MKATTLAGLSAWSAHQPDRRIDFNGFFLADAGGLLVDPMPLGAAELALVREAGGAATILITNADHWRATGDLAAALGARVLAPAGDRERFGDRAPQVGAWISSTQDLPEPLRAHVSVHELRGGKSPVELALHFPKLRALLFGDLVRSHVSGKLTMLPDEKLRDRAAALQSLRPLLALPFDAVLLGDGDCLFRDGREALLTMLDELPGTLFNRLHLDRLEFSSAVRHPKTVSEFAQVSRAMTCRKLGFHVRRIMPGMIWPAFHSESHEEEVFLVRRGRLTLRTPAGEFVLEPGEIVALPPGPAFAHQFRNDGDEPCEFLALSNIEDANVTHYPESGRIAVGVRGEMYRVADKRSDYWEDEPSVR